MTLETLKQVVLEANLALVRKGLVFMTWGNASAIDRERGLIVIKPSGVPYETMRAEQMVAVDIEGAVVEGELKPSVDTATHLVLYKAFGDVGGIVHTHSHYATVWAQAGLAIPCFGTTHADHFYGEVPVTEGLTAEEVAGDYERSIGEAIVRRYAEMNPMEHPAVLAAQHGPFTWGATLGKAVENALALEEVARMALDTVRLAPDTPPIGPYLLAKHFLRKHGGEAYYGQQ